MLEPKFLSRSDEDYHEFNISYCDSLIKELKKTRFKKKSKKNARIYVKAFHPPDCPQVFWMYYLVFEINGKAQEIYSIDKEAFEILIEGIEPNSYESVDFYTIDKNN